MRELIQRDHYVINKNPHGERRSDAELFYKGFMITEKLILLYFIWMDWPRSLDLDISNRYLNIIDKNKAVTSLTAHKVNKRFENLLSDEKYTAKLESECPSESGYFISLPFHGTKPVCSQDTGEWELGNCFTDETKNELEEFEIPALEEFKTFSMPLPYIETTPEEKAQEV